MRRMIAAFAIAGCAGLGALGGVATAHEIWTSERTFAAQLVSGNYQCASIRAEFTHGFGVFSYSHSYGQYGAFCAGDQARMLQNKVQALVNSSLCGNAAYSLYSVELHQYVRTSAYCGSGNYYASACAWVQIPSGGTEYASCGYPDVAGPHAI
jgi:hypothetical protein